MALRKELNRGKQCTNESIKGQGRAMCLMREEMDTCLALKCQRMQLIFCRKEADRVRPVEYMQHSSVRRIFHDVFDCSIHQ